jgi:hypothetical protein
LYKFFKNGAHNFLCTLHSSRDPEDEKMETKKLPFQTTPQHTTGTTDANSVRTETECLSSRESDQGETEDDEVKMSCIGGQSGMHDSDLSSADEVDESEAEQEEQPNSRYAYIKENEW